MRVWLARVLLVGAGLAALLMLAIAANLTQEPLGLERFRESTLAIYGFLLLAWLAHGDLGATARRVLEAARRVLGHPRFFPVTAIVMLGLYVLAVTVRHLAFQTFSHDFAMIDEGLYHSTRDVPQYSPVIGRSFLSEHASPILLLLVPLHRILPSPWLLLIIQPLVLWASGLVLRQVLADEGLPRWAVSLGCVAWWNHPTMISTLQYPVHMESALPLVVLSAWWLAMRRRWIQYGILILLALSVKEDVGLYVAGLGVWLAVTRRSVAVGVLTAVGGLAWTTIALGIVIPAFAPEDGGFRFMGRWSAWGEGPVDIALGFLRHPIDFLAHLLSKSAIRLFAGLLFLPFLSRWSILLFAAPWIVNATSNLSLQANLSLYYGVPLLAFALPAAILGLRSPVFRRMAHSRWGPMLAIALVVFDVAHFSFPGIERRRGEILHELDAIPAREEVQAMSCFHPVLGYERPKAV